MSLYILLAATSIVGVIGSIVVTARDGYRRQPRETFARTVGAVRRAPRRRSVQGRCAGEGAVRRALAALGDPEVDSDG